SQDSARTRRLLEDLARLWCPGARLTWLAAPRWSIPPQAPVAAARTRLAGAGDRRRSRPSRRSRHSSKRREHRLDSGAGKRPVPEHVPAPLPVEVAQVDHRGGRPRKLAAVERKLRVLDDTAGHLGEHARIRLPGDVGARLHDRPGHRGQRCQGLAEPRHPQAEARGVRPAGGGEAKLAVRKQQRHGARQQRLQGKALAWTQLRQRPQRRLQREEHDRARSRRRALLEPVQGFRGTLVIGVAADAVDRIGGDHGDATGGDALPHGAGLGAPDPAAPPAGRLPTTTRSIPARSRSAATPGKPAPRISAPTAGAWPAPTSSAASRTRGRRRRDAISARLAASPSAPANNACAGSWRATSGASAPRSPSATEGRVASTASKRSGKPSSKSPCSPLTATARRRPLARASASGAPLGPPPPSPGARRTPL